MSSLDHLAQALNLVAMLRRLKWYAINRYYKARYHLQRFGRFIQPKLINSGWVKPIFRDRFTGALNHISGIARLEKSLQREGKSVALLLLDFDGFAYVNHEYGHVVGDKILKKFVDQVKQSLKEDQFIVRFGGDEFLVVSEDGSRDRALDLAQQICQIACDLAFLPEPLKLTASVGLVIAENPEEPTDSLIRRADEKMYEAKHAGGDQVCM